MTQYITIDPTTEKKLEKYKLLNWPRVQKAKLAAFQEQKKWRELPAHQRTQLLLGLAKFLRASSESAAQLMAHEMGKPLSQGRSEIEKCAVTCEYYAKNYDRLTQAQVSFGEGNSDKEKIMVVYRPLGVIFGIMPWNFPFWQVIRFAVPTLALGNTVIVKHALNTSGCAILLEEIFNRAGFPPGVYQNLLMDHPTAEKLLLDSQVSGVSLTGSTRAGIEVATIAARTLKKCVFELGGSDAYVVLKDANLEQAIEICGKSRLINSGQSCVAAKRFIVEKSVVKSFTEGLVEFFKKQTVGNPLEEAVTVGPLARKDLKQLLLKQVARSQKKGAKTIYKGEVPKKGFFYPCTILTRVTPGMPAFDEELFGPVAAIIEAKDAMHALELSNQSIYGLGGAIFSENVEKAELLATRDFEAGNVFVNDNVKSMPPYPFGGIKFSGYGRELGETGIHEFANIKTVKIACS